MPVKKIQLFQELSKLYSKRVDESDDPIEYLPTQILADYIESLGYDRIAYSSSLVPELNKENFTCSNFAIFNYKHCVPTKSNIFELKSIYNNDPEIFDYRNYEQTDNDLDKIDIIEYRADKNVYDFKFPFSADAKPSKNNNGLNKNAFVHTGLEIFTIPVYISNYVSENRIVVKLGESVKIDYYVAAKHTNCSITLTKSLNNSINELTCLLAAFENNGLWIGDRENPKRGTILDNLFKEKQYQTMYVSWKKSLKYLVKVKNIRLSQKLYDDVYIQIEHC